MRNLILSFIIVFGFSTSLFSQDINTTYTEVKIGTVVNGNLVEVYEKEDISTVKLTEDTIEITNNGDTVVLTDVEFLGKEFVSNIEIERYKSKNPSGDTVICSFTDGVMTMFNLNNNLVKTLTDSNQNNQQKKVASI